MADLTFDEAYAQLMSAQPYSQYNASVGLRNLAAAASATAQQLRSQGAAAAANGGGDAGAAAQKQANLHADWFDQAAQHAHTTADNVDGLVKTGQTHQATAESLHSNFENAVATGQPDNVVIHQMQSGTQVMNGAATDWSSSYDGFAPGSPPPPPATGSGPPPGGGSGSSGTAGGAGPAGRGATGDTGGSGEPLLAVGPVGAGATPVLDRGPGDAGSVEVGPDGGEFAGWYKDPQTGYYVDPATGREYDPVTSRWIDPVTGQPFGDVTQYATGLQGLGGASTSGGLLTDSAGAGGVAGAAGFTGGAGGAGGGAGLLGGAGGFASLFGAGNTVGIAGGYGGMVPPSLANGSAAAGSLFQQAGTSLAVKQATAESLLAREQAVRAGRPYMPPTQAGLGAGTGAGGRNRPGYLTSEDDESALFSSRRSRFAGAAGEAEEEAGLGRGGRGAGPGAALAEEEEGILGAGALRGGAGARGGGAIEGEEGLFATGRGGLLARPITTTGTASESGGFAGRGATAGRAAGAEGEEAAGTAGRRTYLPPTQANAGGKDGKEKGRDRPDWLVDDDVFAADGAPTGILGD